MGGEARIQVAMVHTALGVLRGDDLAGHLLSHTLSLSLFLRWPLDRVKRGVLFEKRTHMRHTDVDLNRLPAFALCSLECTVESITTELAYHTCKSP